MAAPNESPPPRRSTGSEGAPRRRRWIRRTALGLLAVLLLLAGAVLFLLATEPGARWLVARVGAFVPGELEIGSLSGPVRGPLEVVDLRYRSEAFELTADRVVVDWRLWDLLRRRLDVHRLLAEGVRVVTYPGPEEPEDEPAPLPDVDLPVAVVLREARLRDLRIVAEPPEGAAAGETPEPVVVDRLDLVARVRRGGPIEIAALEVAAPRVDLEVAGTLRPQGAYELDLETRWAYRSAPPSGEGAGEGLPPFAGGGTLSGTLDDLRVRQALETPVRASLEARLSDPLQEPAFRGTVHLDGIRATAIDPAWPEATVTGVVRAEGRPEALAATAELAASTAEWGDLEASLEARRTAERLVLQALELRTAAGGDLAARGSVGLSEPLAADLKLEWDRLSWPLAGEPSVRSPEGRASLEGTLERWTLTAGAELSVPGEGALPARSGRLEVAAAGGDAGADVERAALTLGGGELEARGRVDWQPRVAWDLSLAGRGLDPSTFAAEWPGALDIEGQSRGAIEEEAPVGSVRLARLSGSLRGEPVTGSAAVDFNGDRVQVPELRLRWGAARLAASGSVVPALDLDWRLEAPDLAPLLPEATGSLDARGRLTGPTEAPRVEANLTGRSLSFGETSVAALAAEADVDLTPGGDLFIDLDASDVATAERTLETVTVDLTGTREDHRLSVVLADPRERLEVAAEGNLLSPGAGGPGGEGGAWGWEGRLARLDLLAPDTSALGSWRLASPAPLAVSTAGAGSARWGRLCWVSDGARLCSRGSWAGGGDGGGGGGGTWQAELLVDGVPVALARPLLPPEVQLSGRIDGRLEAAAGPTGVLDAQASFTLGPGRLVYAADGGEVSLPYRGRLEATSGAAGLRGDLELDLGETGSVAGELRVADFRLGREPGEEELSGRVRAELRELGFAGALIEPVGPLDGSLQADLSVSGTLAEPDLSGSAVLTAAAAELPELGVTVRDLRLAAEPAGEGVLRLTGSARSGEGTLSLEGVAPLAPSEEAPVRLRVNGSGFRAVDTAALRARVSPDLEVRYDGELLSVTGEVRVPEAEIALVDDESPEAVQPSEDVVFVGREAEAGGEAPADEEMRFAARVRVVLGEEVTFEGSGLETGLDGSLLVVQEPGAPVRATGELRLEEGTFQAYGQDLQIERGRLVFAGGPVSDPGLDLRAFREARDGTVAGLEARGTLERPEVTIWSEPAMSQTEALSYLLLGRPIGQASPEEGDMLANAAGSLGIRGGNLLVERLAARFGLEEARIETEGTYEEAQLVLGTYLSPRLYVSYGVGLFEAVNTLRIQYLLSSRFTLRTEVGTGTSADVLYTLERGRGEPVEPPGRVGAEELDEPPDLPPASPEPER